MPSAAGSSPRPASPLTALPDAPGVIELDASGDLIRHSSSAEPLLAELSGSTVEAGVRSAAIHAVASATRAVDRPSRRGKRPTLPSSTVQDAGRYLARPPRRAPRRRALGAGRGLHPARAPDPGRSAAAQGVRAHPARAGGGSADPARSHHDPGGATARDLAAHRQRPPRSRSSRRPTPAHAASCPRRCSSASISPASKNQIPVGDDASFIDAPRPRVPDAVD